MRVQRRGRVERGDANWTLVASGTAKNFGMRPGKVVGTHRWRRGPFWGKEVLQKRSADGSSVKGQVVGGVAENSAAWKAGDCTLAAAWKAIIGGHEGDGSFDGNKWKLFGGRRRMVVAAPAPRGL